MYAIRYTLSITLKDRIAIVLLAVFFQATALPASVFAQEVVLLPKPGVMVDLSPSFVPPYLAGINVYPNSPLKFDFIINRGDVPLSVQQKQGEYKKLIKYFLASLAVPDENQWVNLSPYEKDRIVGPDFANTQMGRDLLGQDYILKQITSSLIYPEKVLGKDFWDKVYTEAFKQFGNTNIPVSTFNKVWIVPDSAVIYEKGNSALVLKNHLKVMLEQDYVALDQNAISDKGTRVVQLNVSTSKVMRDVIIPVLEKEVNEGKNFANLRQVYSGMLLAAWYKRVLKESFLAKIYADKSKLKGVDQDPKANQEIYERYLQSTKKGVYSFIKEDVDKYTQQIIPRKYFSGGATGYDFAMVHRIKTLSPTEQSLAQKVFLGTGGQGARIDIVGASFNVDVDLGIGEERAPVAPLKADFDPFTKTPDEKQLAVRIAIEIKFDPYYANLQDMSKNMTQDMRYLFEYDGTYDETTIKDITEILQRIADEVEFDGNTKLVEIYKENGVKSANLGKRAKQYLGLKFKFMNRYMNSGEDLTALSVKAGSILKTIIAERAKSRLDHVMSGIHNEAITEATPIVDAEPSANPVGGIDFNASKLNMQIKRDGNGIVLPVAQQNWESVNIDGLTPVILSIKPALGSSILDLHL